MQSAEMYEIILTKDALHFYEKADISLVKKINRAFHQLVIDPYNHPNIKAIKGSLSGAFRFRIGDWRVVYRIDKYKKQVIILLIVHRKNAYR